MIAFLVITTVINIALGYALAVYLGSADAPSSSERTVRPDRELMPATAISATPERVVAASLADSVAIAAAAPLPPAPAPEAVEPAAATQSGQQEPEEEPSSYRTAGMEQDLLAGIEEFRNQLAQLRTQNFDEEVPTLAGLGQ